MNSRMRIVATLGLLLAVACGDDGGGSDAVDSGYPLEDGGPGPGPGNDDGGGPGNDLDGGPGPGNGDSGPGNDLDGGDTTDGGENGPQTLLYVDDVYFPSGYFEVADGITRSDCAQAGPSGNLAYCHQFDIDAGGSWGRGVFWQYPEGNWNAPGYPVPQGATVIRFWAWSDTAGLMANFGAGIGGPDGTQAPDYFHVERQGVALTTTPTQYEIDISGISYTTVTGGFLFAVIGSGTIFLDGIEWAGYPVDGGDAGIDGGTDPVGDAGVDGGTDPVDDAGVDGGTDPVDDAGTDPVDDAGTDPTDGGTDPVDSGTGEELQTLMYVDDHYFPSGYFETPEGITRLDCAEAGPSGNLDYCHRFDINAGGSWGRGVFWQHPDGSWNGPGYAVPQGATVIRFWAWSTTAGLLANFGAGIGGDGTQAPDFFHVEVKDVALTTTPVQYEIDISNINYTTVAGGFLFAVIGSGTIFLDGIEWAGYPVDGGDAGVDGGTGGGDDAGVDGGSDPVDAGSDAGPELDAGVDAGPEADAGSDDDAGVDADAGPDMDAGPAVDAGPAPDAG